MEKSIKRPISLENWKSIPTFRGRLANKDDVNSGRAMFCTIEAGGDYYEVDLPFCAIYTEEKTGKKYSVIAVQVEKANDEVIVGVIGVDGMTRICTLSELEVVNDPNEEFFRFRKKPWWIFGKSL